MIGSRKSDDVDSATFSNSMRPEVGDLESPQRRDPNLEQSSTVNANASGSEDLNVRGSPLGEMIQQLPMLPLRTPERPLSSSSEIVAQEVRKRTFQLSPEDEEEKGSCEDSKRRQVSKTLVFGSSSSASSSGLEVPAVERKVIARCLFGAPSKEDNDRILRSFEDDVRAKYEQFTKRYIVVEGEENSRPCFY